MLAGLFVASFFLLPLCPFGNVPSATAATGCVAEDDWIYPVVGVQCGTGAAVGSFQAENLPLHTL